MKRGPILPGATLGILGGGQLGRMTAMAARSLGYHVHALDPDASCAARFLVDRCIAASFDDSGAVEELARNCDAVTLEIERISVFALEAAARHAPTRPGPQVLSIVQHRGRQKSWLASHGFPVGPYREARSAAEVADAARDLGGPCFVKLCRGGYDGRGQFQVTGPDGAEEAFDALGGGYCVVEQALDLECELSVMVARRPNGETAVFPPAKNHHEQRILAWSVLPGPLPATIAARAKEIGCGIASAMEVEGLLAIELFLTKQGELLVNELAPRPHNSFHATEVACLTSQFEQLVRAVCDLPLGSVEVVRAVAIGNLLGELFEGPEPPAFDDALALPGVRLHLYGKRVARPGRKMGHLSAAADTPENALALVQLAMKRLSRSR